MRMPQNADEWHMTLAQYLDARATHPRGLEQVALQIAEHMERKDAEIAKLKEERDTWKKAALQYAVQLARKAMPIEQ